MHSASAMSTDLPAPSHEARRAIHDAALDLGGRVNEIAQRIDARLIAELPDVAAAAEDSAEQFAANTRSTVALATAMMATWTDPREALVPPEAIAWLQDAVRRGRPPEDVLRGYRLAHATYWTIWHEALCARIDDAAVLADALGASSAYLFAWLDAFLQPLLEEYVAEREGWARRVESSHAAAVREVLTVAGVDAARQSARLGYELNRWHLGFVAWAPFRDGDDAATPTLERVGPSVAAALGADPRTITIWAGSGEVHGWVGARAATMLHGLPAQLPELADVVVTVGEPGRGVAGFRETHVEARRACRVARLAKRGPASVTAHADVAVAALLTSDLEDARRFVRRYLGALAADDDAARRLLATLTVFHAEGLSYQRAARRIGVHQNTVAYRVRRALALAGKDDPGALELRAAVLLVPLVAGAPDVETAA